LAEDKAVSQMTFDQPHGENASLTLKSHFDADWQTISSGLRRDLGAQIYGQWIRSITLGDFCDLTGTLELLLPSDFSASWVSDHYADRLRLAWSSTNSSVKQLKIRTRPGAPRVELLRASTNAERIVAQAANDALPPRSLKAKPMFSHSARQNVWRRKTSRFSIPFIFKRQRVRAKPT
jgi:chromosomal replication initiation ATPase DnaA